MNLYYGILSLLGLSLWLTPLHSQGKLKDLEQIQLLSQDECVIVQVNADWNIKASIDLGRLKNCKWVNASIDDKQYGAIIANEWGIKSVPTIIMFEYGKEIKRFEAGLSFNLDSDKIKKQINEQIDEIARVAIENGIDGIIAINTSLDRFDLKNLKIKTGNTLGQENGGLSGKPLQKKATQIIKHIHNIDKKIILIGVGGIDSPESAWERICSGASLIQLYTGWIYKGPQLVPDILEGIIKQLNNHQLSSIRDAIGSELKWVE